MNFCLRVDAKYRKFLTELLVSRRNYKNKLFNSCPVEGEVCRPPVHSWQSQ